MATPTRQADALPALTPEQVTRYQRQMVLPEVGVDGQARLLASRVLVVGAGALGTVAGLYLAAAGVGTIGIVDGDRVEASNLHRQVAHTAADLGRPKTSSMADRLRRQNPDVEIREHGAFLTSANAREIIGAYDLVVNGSDNFPARYLINDACVLLGKPLVDAAILRFEGQFTVYMPGSGCYRCLFPEPPPAGSVPSCAEAGVLGALAGVLGSLEAVEALKALVGIGHPPVGRLLLYDALTTEWQSMRWRRDPACAVCGDAPTVTELLDDYEGFCTPAAPAASHAPAVPTLSPDEARERLGARDMLILDVRSDAEYRSGHLPGARSVPLEQVGDAIAGLAREREILCVCAMGGRSARAALQLGEAGLTAYSLAGGTIAWMAAGLPVERE